MDPDSYVNHQQLGISPPADDTSRQRFSFMSTPVEMHAPSFPQFPGPTEPAITQSPTSPEADPNLSEIYLSDQQSQSQSQPNFLTTKQIKEGIEIPNLPVPTEPHPAFFAPYADQNIMSQSSPPSETPLTHYPRQESDREIPRPRPISMEKDAPTSPLSPIHPVHQPDQPWSPQSLSQPIYHQNTLPTYNPDATSGPNGVTPNIHQPGQIAHPNQNLKGGTWNHGICGDCILTAVQRLRIRKMYRIQGSIFSDCAHSYCCPCVLIQDEKEVRYRERSAQINSGLAMGAGTTVYVSPPGMEYAPPPR
ncbi:MAG: hypothetical protein M1834_005466 [Cirrosporium novae-zelandiae]|nr:MAG: hypothetical protein M1834_005466 [Cirrosporium novae-zelandiae]